MKFDLWAFFENLSRKFKSSIKYNKNNEWFTWWRLYIYNNPSLHSSSNEKYFRQKCRENEVTLFCSIFPLPPPRKACRLWENVDKYSTARQATDDNILRRMRFARWVNKITYTHSEYVVLIAFHTNRGYVNALQCYIYIYIACLVWFSVTAAEMVLL